MLVYRFCARCFFFCALYRYIIDITLDTIEGPQEIDIEDDPYEYDDDYVKQAKAETPLYQNDEQILIEGELRCQILTPTNTIVGLIAFGDL